MAPWSSDRCRQEELYFVQKHEATATLPRGQCWFLIDAKWNERWWAYATTADSPAPGPITNETLVEDSWRLRLHGDAPGNANTPCLGLQLATDYVCVTSLVWCFLVELHGTSGLPPLARYTKDIYSVQVPSVLLDKVLKVPRLQAKVLVSSFVHHSTGQVSPRPPTVPIDNKANNAVASSWPFLAPIPLANWMQLQYCILLATDIAFHCHNGSNMWQGVALASVWISVPTLLVQFAITTVRPLCSHASAVSAPLVVGIWFQTALVFAGVASVPVILSYVSMGKFLVWIVQDPSTVATARVFAATLAVGVPPQFAFSALVSVFGVVVQGGGGISPLVVAHMLTWILNGLLNVLFLHGCIGVPPLGVHGPAWATVMSQYVQLIAFALWALIASPSWNCWGGWSLECIRRFPTFVASAMTTSWVWKTILDWACACAVLVFAASSSTMNATQTSTQAFFLVLFHCGRVFAQSIGDASVQAEGSNARVHATVVVLGALGVFSASVGLGGDRFVGFFLGTDPQVVDAFRSVEPAFLWALGLLTGSTVMQVWLLQGADEEFFHRVGHMCATAFVYAPLSYVMGVTWQWGFGGMWWSMVCSQVWTILALCWVTVRGTSSVQSLVDEESRSLLPLQRAPSQETSRQHDDARGASAHEGGVAEAKGSPTPHDDHSAMGLGLWIHDALVELNAKEHTSEGSTWLGWCRRRNGGANSEAGGALLEDLYQIKLPNIRARASPLALESSQQLLWRDQDSSKQAEGARDTGHGAELQVDVDDGGVCCWQQHRVNFLAPHDHQSESDRSTEANDIDDGLDRSTSRCRSRGSSSAMDGVTRLEIGPDVVMNSYQPCVPLCDGSRQQWNNESHAEETNVRRSQNRSTTPAGRDGDGRSGYFPLGMCDLGRLNRCNDQKPHAHSNQPSKSSAELANLYRRDLPMVPSSALGQSNPSKTGRQPSAHSDVISSSTRVIATLFAEQHHPFDHDGGKFPPQHGDADGPTVSSSPLWSANRRPQKLDDGGGCPWSCGALSCLRCFRPSKNSTDVYSSGATRSIGPQGHRFGRHKERHPHRFIDSADGGGVAGSRGYSQSLRTVDPSNPTALDQKHLFPAVLSRGGYNRPANWSCWTWLLGCCSSDASSNDSSKNEGAPFLSHGVHSRHEDSTYDTRGLSKEMPAAQGAIDSSKLGSSTSPLEGTWTNDHHRLGSHVVGAAQTQRSGSNETPSWVVRHDIKGSRSDATTAQSDPSRAFAANMSYQSGNAMESAHDPSRSDQNVGSIASGTSTNVYTDSTLHYQLNSPSATSCVIDMSSPTGGIGGVLSHQVSQDNQRYGSTIQSHTRKTTTQLPLSTYRGHLSDYKVDLSTQPSPDADSSPKETSRLLRPHDADLEGSCDKATTLIDPAALTPSRNDLTVAAVHDILDTLIPDMELCITTQGCLAIWREARVFLCMFPCVCFRFVVVQLILDTELIFVGHLGVPQLAGLGLVRFWVAIPFGFLYCSMRAVYVLGSMTRGNRPSAAGHWLQTALGFALVGTLAVSYYYVHVADLAHLAALDDVAISYAREFAPIVLLGLFPSLAMAAMDNFMRIQGIALPALVCATVACVLNIYLHFVFIYGAFGWSGWGFVGSPWATVTSLVTQVALYVAYTVLWKRYHVPYWSGWAWNSHRLHRYRLFWRVSVPLGGMVVVFSIACLIVGTIASYSPSPFTAPHRQLDDGGVGSERVGAWVISFCLFLLVLAVLLGVAEATKVRMLVYLTHGRPKLARQVLYVGLAYSTLIALVFASALFMYKSVVFRIWTNDAGILEQCVDVVRWIMLCLVLSSVRVVLASGLIVLKKRPMVLLAQCIDVWCVQVPGSFVLPLLLQFQHLSGFWIAVAMGECVHVLLLVYALCQVNGDDDQALVKSVKAAFALVNQTSSPFKAKRNERENSDYDIHLCDLTKPLTLSHVVTVNALCDAPPTVQFVVTADVAIDVLTGSLSDHNHTSVCGADAPQLHVETRSTNGCTLSHELATAFHEDGSSDDSNALKAGVSSVHSGHTKAGSSDGDTGITDTERDKYSSLLHIPVSTSLRGVGMDNPSTLALDGSPFPQVKHARSSAVPPRIYSTAAHAVECEAHSLGEASTVPFPPPKILAQQSAPPRSETIEHPFTENEVGAKSSSNSPLNSATIDNASAPPRLQLRDILTPEIPPKLPTLPMNAIDLAPPTCLYRTLTPLENPTKLGDPVLESNRQIKTQRPDAVCTLSRPQDQAAASATFASSVVDDDDGRSAVPLVEVHVADAQKLVPEAINVLEQIEVKLPLDNDSSTDVILLKPIRSVQAEVALLNETTSPQPPSDAGSDSSNDGTTGQVSESESGASSTSQRRRPKAAVPPSVQIETLGGVDISTLHFGKRSKKRRTREAKQSKRVSFSPSPRQRRPSAYGIQPSLD